MGVGWGLFFGGRGLPRGGHGLSDVGVVCWEVGGVCVVIGKHGSGWFGHDGRCFLSGQRGVELPRDPERGSSG